MESAPVMLKEEQVSICSPRGDRYGLISAAALRVPAVVGLLTLLI